MQLQACGPVGGVRPSRFERRGDSLELMPGEPRALAAPPCAGEVPAYRCLQSGFCTPLRCPRCEAHQSRTDPEGISETRPTRAGRYQVHKNGSSAVVKDSLQGLVVKLRSYWAMRIPPTGRIHARLAGGCTSWCSRRACPGVAGRTRELALLEHVVSRTTLPIQP